MILSNERRLSSFKKVIQERYQRPATRRFHRKPLREQTLNNDDILDAFLIAIDKDAPQTERETAIKQFSDNIREKSKIGNIIATAIVCD